MRPFAEARAILLERAKERRNPFRYAELATVERVLGSLDSLDPEVWCAAWCAEAAPHERAGEWPFAYEYYRVARYTTVRCPAQAEAYRRSQQCFLRLPFDPPLERVEIPFREGGRIVGYLRKPRAVARAPVVVLWGGIDSFKEERRPEPFLAAGLATLAIDMAGTGDAPIAGSANAERMWEDVFDWVAARRDVNGTRIAIVGGSTGGYWAAKLAHTHRERLTAAVDHAGCAHHAFAPEWIARAERGEYPFALAETLARAFGGTTEEDWIALAPSLSLLRLGILDRPCAPLLLVNGVDDSVFPIADMYLLLEHGEAKSARFFPTGHMGGPEATDTIVRWLAARLAPSGAA